MIKRCNNGQQVVTSDIPGNEQDARQGQRGSSYVWVRREKSVGDIRFRPFQFIFSVSSWALVSSCCSWINQCRPALLGGGKSCKKKREWLEASKNNSLQSSICKSQRHFVSTAAAILKEVSLLRNFSQVTVFAYGVTALSVGGGG